MPYVIRVICDGHTTVQVIPAGLERFFERVHDDDSFDSISVAFHKHAPRGAHW